MNPALELGLMGLWERGNCKTVENNGKRKENYEASLTKWIS